MVSPSMYIHIEDRSAVHIGLGAAFGGDRLGGLVIVAVSGRVSSESEMLLEPPVSVFSANSVTTPELSSVMV
jgi:hypothetical protein